MIQFFRKIRQKLLTENKFSKYLLYAIGEIILVVIGILIALQINNWNENLKSQKEQYFILNKLQSDINSDINLIQKAQGELEINISNFIWCLEVLGRKEEASKEEFFNKFGAMIAIIGFNQNTTTFNNLVSSGKLELIDNKSLSDAIVKYYTNNYRGWDTAMRDYTRNSIGPYLLRFDHIPQMNQTDGLKNNYDVLGEFYEADIASFDVQPKNLEDYRKDLFIINALRQKIFNYQGQLGQYKNLLKEMEQLVEDIENEKEKIT